MTSITPARRTLLVLAILIGLGVLHGIGWMLAQVWISVATLAVIAAGVDLLTVLAMQLPTVEREVPSSLALGVRAPVTLAVTNHGRFEPRALLHDVHPLEFADDALPLKVRLAHGISRYQYPIRPNRRGDAHFGRVDCLLHSPLGLWWRKVVLGEPTRIRVYPNFSAISRYALLATEDRLAQIGVRKKRRRGEGSEFQQLREYRPGDAMRQIDWRATARTRKLISREYQDERDQSVIFLLDCGRRMRAQDGPLAHFDEALNAVLLLAYVALRKGDAVGVGTFGGDERWFSPVKGHISINRMLNQLYDVKPSLKTPDYARAAADLLSRHKKHAMVVIVTNLRDEDAQDMRAAAHILSKHHRVLIASMREQAVDDALSTPVTGLTNALRVAAAYQYTASRQHHIEELRVNGIDCLDVLPAELPVQLVNLYLAIKARGAL